MDTNIENTVLISQLFPVVGIGTAASEIDILKKILSELPEDSGIAYIIIENLSQPQSENLAELLASHTKIPVTEIVNQVSLKPNHVYVVPENNFLVFDNGILKLKLHTRSSKVNYCLDIFFDALAQSYTSYATGLLLSGTPLDGSAGLKKIKELGGSSIASVSKKGLLQNEITSEFIDYFAPPNEIVPKVLQIHNSYLVNHAYVEEEIAPDEEEFFNQIIDIIVLKTGTNFHHYKDQTLRRRIAKRMVITRQESTEKYLNLLKDNTKEQDLLFYDILIPVTFFFRDELFFDNLYQTVFPSLIENLNNKNLRIWSAGCSTGEEPYSLAICIHEYLQQINNNTIKVQILASDLSEHCIAKARSGVYTPQDVKHISDERLNHYFTKKDNSYHINKTIRDMCIFAVHDLTKDAPFAKIDFVSCRNVLIYFDSNLQNHVLASFHYALRENGILFLGKSESANNVQNLFTIAEKHEKIYTRKSIEKYYNPERFRNLFHKSSTKVKSVGPIINPEKDFSRITAAILLEQYSPAAVIINEELEIVHFHGDTSPYLQPPSGKPSFNILSMVRDEVCFELRNSILKARNEKKNFTADFIAVKNQSFLTSFEVISLPSHPELLLIIFCKKTNKPIHAQQPDAAAQARIQELEKELTQLSGDFRRVTEDQQIYFEELQTTNEELLNSTENLQHANDQLVVSAEELHSNNEELSCLNDELRDRSDELSSMRSFYESIIKTIHEPIMIIDKNYRVKSANPSFYNYFKTTQEETEGVSIFEIGSSEWNFPEFKDSVLKKIGQNETVENLKLQFNFETGGKKVMIINAAPIVNSIPEGMILIAIEDITDLEQSSESLKVKNLEMRGYSRQLEAFTAVASHNLLDPIRKIYMFGKKILDSEKNLTESGKHNVKRLISSAVNMNQLIEDLIDYSKINFAEKQFKKTDLNLLIKKTIGDLKGIISKNKANIVADSLPSLNIIPAQIQQLFTHLISNSIKYAKEDCVPEIKIGMTNPSDEEIIALGANPKKDYIKLFVSDNGIGFNKDFESLIFNPFYKLNNNDQNYGSGLGLTLSQKIVSNHKGIIKVSSEPAKGTTVFIYLPL